MTKLLSPVLADFGPGRVAFWCPGCECTHQIPVAAQQTGAAWSYNENPASPTFSPSILMRTGHYIPSEQGKRCWCDYNREQIAAGKEPAGFECGVCHSFVTDGRIQFLSDCTHALAGQTVDLPEYPI